MDPKRKQAARTSLPFALAAALAPAAFAGQGCSDNRLPPRELPRAEEQQALPRWYPEKPWSEQGGESQVYIEGKIVFDTSKATIRPGSEKTLETLLQFIKEHPEVTRLRIEGHTDAQSSEEHNQALSARRALAVADWLVDHEVESDRLIAVGFGESRPLGPNEIAAGRSENRRVEFHVAEVNGRPFLGQDPYRGGLALEVLSLEQRKQRAEQAAQLKAPPPRKGFVATGDEIKPVQVKPRATSEAQEGEPPAPSAPAKESAPPRDGGGAAPAGGG
ncbi:OmpA family protein [Sorangium sp. So ce302]|uniref:OmpA family protein n=1 Tax=unclassified Sorangium TaxID=2621164 RepID=UPI003F6083F1